jgi:hypothetical protein
VRKELDRAALESLLDGPENPGIGHGAIVHGDTVDDGYRVQQAAHLDLVDESGVLGPYGLVLDVVIVDVGGIAETTLQLRADQCGDLLRRPGGTSTPAETRGLRGKVEYLYGDNALGHGLSPKQRLRRHRRTRGHRHHIRCTAPL